MAMSTYKNKDMYSKMHIHLFIFMMLDFLFTYIGINNIGIIKEGNPLLIWLFEMPFIYSFSIRLGYSMVIVALCYYVKKVEYTHYDKFILFCVGINIVVMGLHFRWVITYLNLLFS